VHHAFDVDMRLLLKSIFLDTALSNGLVIKQESGANLDKKKGGKYGSFVVVQHGCDA